MTDPLPISEGWKLRCPRHQVDMRQVGRAGDPRVVRWVFDCPASSNCSVVFLDDTKGSP